MRQRGALRLRHPRLQALRMRLERVEQQLLIVLLVDALQGLRDGRRRRAIRRGTLFASLVSDPP